MFTAYNKPLLGGIFMLDRTSSIPLHKQIEDLIRSNIYKSTWKPGQMIPSENELCQTYGISRMTVRNVITKLVQEEVLTRTAGKGTFVSDQKIVAQSLSYSGIREQLEQMGYEVQTKLLSINKQTVSTNIFEEFNCDPNMEFFVIQRLRFFQGIPFSLHTSYVPAYLCNGLEKEDLEKEQLCNLLDNVYGLKRSKTIETLESVAAQTSEAEYLEIKKGHPLLLLNDYIFDFDNHLFEYTKVLFRGEKIKLRFEYK